MLWEFEREVRELVALQQDVHGFRHGVQENHLGPERYLIQ